MIQGLASPDINTYLKVSIIKSELLEQEQTNKYTSGTEQKPQKQTHILFNIMKWSITYQSYIPK